MQTLVVAVRATGLLFYCTAPLDADNKGPIHVLQISQCPAQQRFSRPKLFDHRSGRRLQFEPLEERRLLTITAQLVAPLANLGLPGQLVEFNGETVFVGQDVNNQNNLALFKTDGTPEGTVVIKDFFVSGMNDLININGTLFFSVLEPTRSSELWKSDGTAAGTVLVKDFPNNDHLAYADPAAEKSHQC